MSVPSKTLTALAASALLVSFAGTARAQTPYSSDSSPARDIPASCRNVERLANGYVSAECEAGGGWRWSALRPTDCRTSISNRDGVLTCTGARATVGALYPDSGGYGGQVTTLQPDGIIGALFGAVFGNAYSNDQQIEEDYSNGRRPLGERRVALEARIDAGIRDGSLNRTEADRLLSEYNALVRLETRYAADGRLTTQERTDLRTRYNALSQRVGDARNDAGYGDGHGWRSLADQRVAFNNRVDAALRDRRISRTAANRLRTDFDALLRIETGYQRDGLSDREQQDLETRYADLNRRIGDVVDDGGGYGNDPRANQIEARITAGERNGSISRAEASRFREELRDLGRRWTDLETRVSMSR